MNPVRAALPPNSRTARKYSPHKLDRLQSAGILQRCSGDNCHLRKFTLANLDCPPLCRLSCHRPSSREVYPKSGEVKARVPIETTGTREHEMPSRCERTGQRKDTRS